VVSGPAERAKQPEPRDERGEPVAEALNAVEPLAYCASVARLKSASLICRL
jgi:hypothetical protein